MLADGALRRRHQLVGQLGADEVAAVVAQLCETLGAGESRRGGVFGKQTGGEHAVEAADITGELGKPEVDQTVELPPALVPSSGSASTPIVGLLREVAFLQARRETVSRMVDASRAALRFALPTGTEPHRRHAARASLANTPGLQGGSLDSVLKNAGAWVARMPDATPVVDQGITTTSALQTTVPSRR